MIPLDPTLVIILTVVLGLMGLAIGSFLNVVIWRLPRGESLVAPPSACPGCGRPIRARDNVPVVSWLLLRRKCRDCGIPISARYPLVELGTAIFFVLVTLYLVAQPAGLWALPAFLVLAAVSVALAAIDLDVKRLPNAIVIPALVAGAVLLALASAGAGDWWPLLRGVIGAAILFAFYLGLALLYPAGMGFGDVKLAALLGLYLGWVGWGALVIGAFSGFLLGGLFALVLVITGRAKRKSGIPFGPWMLAGAWIGIFFGNSLWNGYLSFVGLVAS